MNKLNSRFKLFLLIASIAFALDVLTKQIILFTQFSTSGFFVDISHVFNTGSLWGLFSSVTFINIVFMFISVVAFVLLYYIQKLHPSLTWAVGLMTGGILGNLLDRMIFGAVFDWINFHFWPVFNLADSFIVCGVMISAIILVKEEFDKKK